MHRMHVKKPGVGLAGRLCSQEHLLSLTGVQAPEFSLALLSSRPASEPACFSMAGKMAQRREVHASRPSNPTSIPGSHKVAEKNLLTSICRLWHVLTCTHIDTPNLKKGLAEFFSS